MHVGGGDWRKHFIQGMKDDEDDDGAVGAEPSTWVAVLFFPSFQIVNSTVTSAVLLGCPMTALGRHSLMEAVSRCCLLHGTWRALGHSGVVSSELGARPILHASPCAYESRIVLCRILMTTSKQSCAFRGR